MRGDINQNLTDALETLKSYNRFVQEASKQHVAPSEHENQEMLMLLTDALDDTRSELTKELSENRVVRIDQRIVKAMDQAITDLANMDTEDKVNAVHVAIYGSFWSVLREVQNLLHTITGLKRGKRASNIDEMDKDRDNKE